MPLKEYQQEIALNTLYSVGAAVGGEEQLRPNIQVIGGTVNIFGSQEIPASPLTDMFLTAEGFSGIDAFGVIPNYIYITQNSGTTEKIILSGMTVDKVP